MHATRRKNIVDSFSHAFEQLYCHDLVKIIVVLQHFSNSRHMLQLKMAEQWQKHCVTEPDNVTSPIFWPIDDSAWAWYLFEIRCNRPQAVYETNQQRYYTRWKIPTCMTMASYKWKSSCTIVHNFMQKLRNLWQWKFS